MAIKRQDPTTAREGPGAEKPKRLAEKRGVEGLTARKTRAMVERPMADIAEQRAASAAPRRGSGNEPVKVMGGRGTGQTVGRLQGRMYNRLDLVNKLQAEGGGFTINPRTLKQPETGFAVSIEGHEETLRRTPATKKSEKVATSRSPGAPASHWEDRSKVPVERSKPTRPVEKAAKDPNALPKPPAKPVKSYYAPMEEVSDTSLTDYTRRHKEALLSEGAHFGAYSEVGENTSVLDVSRVHPETSEGHMAARQQTRQHKQQSYYDLGKGEVTSNPYHKDYAEKADIDPGSGPYWDAGGAMLTPRSDTFHDTAQYHSGMAPQSHAVTGGDIQPIHPRRQDLEWD